MMRDFFRSPPQVESRTRPMLQAIRTQVGSWIVKILFIVLILSFAVWGITDYSQGGRTDVAKVGGVPITTQQLDDEFRQEVNRLRQVVRPDFTAAQARQFGILDQTLEQLIQQTLLRLDAQALGLRVGDAVVAAEIAEQPVFRNSLGQFDAQLMRAILRQNGLTEQALIEQVRSDMVRLPIVGAVQAGAAAPALLGEELFRYRNEQRVADVVTIPVAALPDPAPPEESVLTDYHAANAPRYTSPEYRTLTIAKLTAESLAGEISVTEEDIVAAYEARAAEFITPERRDIVQAVLPDEAAAAALAEAVRDGQTLADAAAAAGTETVTLDDSVRDDLLPELVEPVFGAEPGTLAGPVESALGWHVFTVTEVTPGGERPLAEIREQVVADLRRDRAIDRLFEVANQMDDALAGGATLEEAVEQGGAQLITVAGVDSDGLTPGGQPAAEVQDIPTVVQAGFALPQGETGNMTEVGDDGYFAVRVDSVQPAALKPFADVRTLVLADWTQEQKAQAAAAKAADLAERLRAGGDPSTLAAEVPGATSTRTERLLRTAGRTGVLPQPVVDQLFTLAPGQVATGVSADGQVVARLVEVVPADPSAAPEQVAEIRRTVGETVGGDLIAQYVAGLEARFPVDRNRAVLDTLYTEP